METARLSTKYQLVIPKRVREALDLRPGQRFTVVVKGNVVSLVPVGDLRRLRGILPTANTGGVRDRSDVA